MMRQQWILALAAGASLVACSGSAIQGQIEGEAGAPGAAGQETPTDGGTGGTGGTGAAAGTGAGVGGTGGGVGGTGGGVGGASGGEAGASGGVGGTGGGGAGEGGSAGTMLGGSGETGGGSGGSAGAPPCVLPTYSEDCSQVPYFQCGFEAHCEGNTVVASWHEHVLCSGSTYEQIAGFTCSYPCSVACDSEYLGWPQRGTGLVADVCGEDVGGPRRVFVTSEEFAGDIGSLEIADGHCQRLAEAAGQPGTWKAWLSDGTSSPATRFTHSDEGYVYLAGDWLAESWDELIAQGPTHSIHYDETDQRVPEGAMVWTGTDPQGLSADETCERWTTAQNAQGGAGDAWSELDWTLATPMSCDSNARLYCFQQ